ncbi:MAG: hypothetical protein ACKVOM_02555 [Ferruginibacter sp.]
MQSGFMEGTAPDIGLFILGLSVVILLVLFAAFIKSGKNKY